MCENFEDDITSNVNRFLYDENKEDFTVKMKAHRKDLHTSLNWKNDKTYTFDDFDTLHEHFTVPLNRSGYDIEKIKKEWKLVAL